MIRSLTLTGHGLRRARRHLGAVLLVYLASLVPALLVVSLFSADLAPSLDDSLFAGHLLTGRGFGVWIDAQRSPDSDLQPIQSVLPSRLLLGVLLQILVAAGLVEVLFDRAGTGERPFLSGIGRHGWRFVRSAVVFVFFLGIALALAAPIRLAFDGGGDRLALLGVLVYLLVALALYVVLDLAYDFSRVSAAAHGEGRMLVGFFKALRFVLRRFAVLVPLYILFSLLIVGLQVGLVALRSGWKVDTPGEVVGWLGAQQAVFFVLAFFRTALWGAEVAYFQGLGEPSWCGRKPETVASPVSRPTPVSTPGPAPAQVQPPTGPASSPEPAGIEAAETPAGGDQQAPGTEEPTKPATTAATPAAASAPPEEGPPVSSPAIGTRIEPWARPEDRPRSLDETQRVPPLETDPEPRHHEEEPETEPTPSADKPADE